MLLVVANPFRVRRLWRLSGNFRITWRPPWNLRLWLAKTEKYLKDFLEKEIMIPYQTAFADVDEACKQPAKELADAVEKGFELGDSLFKLFGFQFVPSSNLAENEEQRTAAVKTLRALFIFGNTEFSELENHRLLRPLVSMLEAEKEEEKRRIYGVMNEIMMERDLLGKDHELPEEKSLRRKGSLCLNSSPTM